MPDYLIYVRAKNSKFGKPLFKGEPIKATDPEAAKTKALHRDHSLRRSRLMASLAPPIQKELTKIEVEGVGERVEALTPEQMKAVLTPKEG